MRTEKGRGIALLCLIIGGCGGADPHDAPGCEPGAQRCDGDVIQVCVLDATRRAALWVDAADCAEPDQAFTCLDGEGGSHRRASCELAPDTGGGRDAGRR